MRCPHCGSGDITYDTNRKVQSVEGFNALLRAKRCRSCGRPFATIETPVIGAVAEAIDHAIGGWNEVPRRNRPS